MCGVEVVSYRDRLSEGRDIYTTYWVYQYHLCTEGRKRERNRKKDKRRKREAVGTEKLVR
jgi:hypothetical protein